MIKPQDGYIAYIVNPKSGATSSKPIGRQFLHYLRQKNYDVKVSLTSSLSHANELANEAAVDYQCALVVVVGGDGTVREVVHGLEGSNKPLIIVPHGTENLLASELGFDERLTTLIRAFETGQLRPLDIGKVNDRYFTSIVGFGFDARIVQRLSLQRNGNIDYSDYFWPAWRTFWDYQYPPLHVEADSQQLFQGPALVFVGNISRYALGLKILHHADYGDGLLDICIYKCHSKLQLAKHSIMTVLKRHRFSRDVIYQQAKHIRVSSPVASVPTEIDGDPGPPLPVEIQVVPKAVNILVPKGAKPAGMRTRLIRALG